MASRPQSPAEQETVNERRDVKIAACSQAGKDTVDERKDLKIGDLQSSVRPLEKAISSDTAQLLSRSALLQQEVLQALEPFVERMRSLLESAAGRRFEIERNGLDEAGALVESLIVLTRQAGCQLTYQGEPVTIYCAASPRSRSVQLIVSTVRRRPQKTLSSSTYFPSLDVSLVSKLESSEELA